MSVKYKVPFLIFCVVIGNIFILWVGANVLLPQGILARVSKLAGVTITGDMLLRNRLVLNIIGMEAVILPAFMIIVGILVYIFYVNPIIKLNSAIKGEALEDLVQMTKRSDEIGQLQNNYVKMKQQLSNEKEIRNRMMASIAHDIKTPLTSILGYSETLVSKEVEQERRQIYLKTIYKSAKDVEDIINEFEYFVEGQLESNLLLKEYSIKYIVQMLEEEYKEDLLQKKYHFSVKNDCHDNTIILCDIMKLRRIFANLIGNSIKHNKKSEMLSIQVSVKENKHRVIFQVQDNGEGVSSIEVQYIFEPFYTSDQSRVLSGLGLAICKNLTEVQGGKIEVQSGLNRGFAVNVYMNKKV